MSDPEAPLSEPSDPAAGRAPIDLSVLHSLLTRWADGRQVGRPVPFEGLTNDPRMPAEIRRLVGLDAVDPGMAPTADHAAVPGPADPGRPTIPGYDLLDVVGRGGMGLVYRAHDTALMRDVAIKVLLPEYAHSQSAIRRFREEALITGQLQHPGIPPVHEVGVLPDGRPYLAMKLVKGQTFDAMLKARSTPADEHGRLLVIFEQVCQAVAYAHSHNVIHRDLKPANVMVGAFGEVQVMDWGLARVLDAKPTELDATESPERTKIRDPRANADSSGTQAGSVVGTPAYIPPEQAAGDLAAVDRRSDVFGLGGLLFAGLTAQPPLVGPAAAAVRLQAVGPNWTGPSRLDASGAEPELVALRNRASPRNRRTGRPTRPSWPRGRRLPGRARGAGRAADLDRAAAEARAVEQRKRRRVRSGLAAVPGCSC